MSGFTMLYTTKAGGLVQIEGHIVKYWKGTGLPDYEGDMEGLEKTFPGVVAEMVKRKVLVLK